MPPITRRAASAFAWRPIPVLPERQQTEARHRAQPQAPSLHHPRFERHTGPAALPTVARIREVRGPLPFIRTDAYESRTLALFARTILRPTPARRPRV